MSMRDLIYKIVPQKVVVRELKTSTGKVLTKDSEYTLVERKKYITVGKKTQVDYVFELDIKEITGISKKSSTLLSESPYFNVHMCGARKKKNECDFIARLYELPASRSQVQIRPRINLKKRYSEYTVRSKASDS